jgi:hypothetical protein
MRPLYRKVCLGCGKPYTPAEWMQRPPAHDNGAAPLWRVCVCGRVGCLSTSRELTPEEHVARLQDGA